MSDEREQILEARATIANEVANLARQVSEIKEGRPAIVDAEGVVADRYDDELAFLDRKIQSIRNLSITINNVAFGPHGGDTVYEEH